ncbi:MAG: hypothetical protein Q8O89_05095 [Nanoarchaeota archaeon]|nr:hypothetical protein [Nanoarchaeota archaeon]
MTNNSSLANREEVYILTPYDGVHFGGSARPKPEELLPDGKQSLLALVVNTTSFYNDGNVIPYVKRAVSKKVPVFVVASDKEEFEIESFNESVKPIVEAGAIPLGKTNLWTIDKELKKILVSSNGLENGVIEAYSKLHKPLLDIGETQKIISFLKDSEPIDVSKYSYCNYAFWKAIKNSPNYSSLAQAGEKASENILTPLLEQMKDKGILDYYSMGPSPKIDKQLLAKAVQRKQTICYHAIDTSKHALAENETEITQFLEQINPRWKKYVQIVNEIPQSFDKVHVGSNACVSYFGGQMVNQNDFFRNASKMFESNGILVADTHLHSAGGDNEQFWKQIYDIPEEKAMFAHALGLLFPKLAESNGWHVAIEYEKSNPDRISFQLKTEKDIVIPLYGPTFSVIRANMTERCDGLAYLLSSSDKPREVGFSKKYNANEFFSEASDNGFTPVCQKAEKIKIPNNANGSVMSCIFYKK